MLSDTAAPAAFPDDAELARLNQTYAGWHVWRSYHQRGRPAAWVATNLDPASDRAPTLHADTLVELERQLQNPPAAHGRGLEALTAKLQDPDTRADPIGADPARLRVCKQDDVTTAEQVTVSPTLGCFTWSWAVTVVPVQILDRAVTTVARPAATS